MEINKSKVLKNSFFILPFILIFFIFHIISYFTSIQIISNNNKIRKLDNKEEEEILHLVKYNFTTKHNPKELEDPITYLLLNDITIPINLGTPSQTILTSLRFNDYPFFLSSPSIKLKNENEEELNNLFLKNNSKSYRFISNDQIFYKSQLTKAEKANETFYFNNNTNIVNNFTFYYATKMDYNQSGGVIGLCLEDSNMNLHSGMNFLTQLKKANAISYRTFIINYNKNKEEGEFIIGAYPHEYSKDKYKYENLFDISGYKDITFSVYGFIFDEINIGDNKMILTITNMSEGNKKEMTADLRIEFGFILAPSILEENITKEFIDLYKCNAYFANFNDIYGNKIFQGESYKYYACDKSYKTKSKLSFLSREMEYVFELDQNDLFMTYGDKIYFNIIFQNSGYRARSWIFGKPLFLKYKWVFDPDNKRFGFYGERIIDKEEKEKQKQKEEGKNNIILIIILIITIFIFLIVLSIFIYEFFIKKNKEN